MWQGHRGYARAGASPAGRAVSARTHKRRPGLELIGPERLQEIEPHVFVIKALYFPTTGIVDLGHVACAFARCILSVGGEILTDHEVIALKQNSAGARLITPSHVVEAQHLISCVGLYADRLARLACYPPSPRIVLFRGDYYLLRQERSGLVRGLIYPVPDSRFPFTRRLNGEVWLGPNTVLAFNAKALWETLRYCGFRKLAFRYWRVGLKEFYRDVSKAAFLNALIVTYRVCARLICFPGHPAYVRRRLHLMKHSWTISSQMDKQGYCMCAMPLLLPRRHRWRLRR